MLQRLRGHYFWPEPLNRDSVVVDAGAHRGEFSAAIIQRFGSRCHLIEANPTLAAQLHVPGAESVLNVALGAHEGRATFHLRENLESSSLAGSSADSVSAVEVEIISLPTLLRRIGTEHLDLLKLDIEGAEFELIDATPDEVWRRVSQITVEFHDFQERFAGRGLFEKARARLESLGFVCCLMSFRTHGDVLFLNRARLPLGPVQSFYAGHLARYPAKLKVLANR